jgi:hypothetical protein
MNIEDLRYMGFRLADPDGYKRAYDLIKKEITGRQGAGDMPDQQFYKPFRDFTRGFTAARDEMFNRAKCGQAISREEYDLLVKAEKMHIVGTSTPEDINKRLSLRAAGQNVFRGARADDPPIVAQIGQLLGYSNQGRPVDRMTIEISFDPTGLKR